MQYFYDTMRHLVCVPYSIDNLHVMAKDLGIGKHWFDPSPYPHYDIPKRMMEAINRRAKQVRPREVLAIVKNKQLGEELLRTLVREEVWRCVANSAGMVGGADLGRSSGNRPPTMAALGGGAPASDPNDIMGRAEELYKDLKSKLDDIVQRGNSSPDQVKRLRQVIDRALVPLMKGDKTETPVKLEATIDSLTAAVDALAAAV